MYSQAETAKGVVTAAAGGAGLAWLTEANIASTVSFACSIVGAAWCWWSMKKAEQARADQEIADRKARADQESLDRSRDADRHQQLLDLFQGVQISDIRVASMVSDLMKPAAKQIIKDALTASALVKATALVASALVKDDAETASELVKDDAVAAGEKLASPSNFDTPERHQ